MSSTYLDNAATTRPDPRVVERIRSVMDTEWGNPSSLHRPGRAARRIVEDSREEVAAALGVHPRTVTFTSGGTEANNTAIHGFSSTRDGALVCSPIEHPSVLEPVRRMEAAGREVRWLPVGWSGAVDLTQVEATLGDAAFVTTMAVNNETGATQPVAEIATLCQARGIPFHVDAVQAVGKSDFNLAEVAATSFSISPHKIHGPKGIGILIVREESHMAPLIVGGGQERERRAGTESIALIAGAALAVHLAVDELEAHITTVHALESQLLDGLEAAWPGAALNTGTADHSSGIISLRLPGGYGETVMMGLDLDRVAISVGSACSSGAVERSHVLEAMGLDLVANHASIRVSLSSTNTERDITSFLDALSRHRLRAAPKNGL